LCWVRIDEAYTHVYFESIMNTFIFRPSWTQVSYNKQTLQVDGFLQQFHLVIKYKKGNTNRLEDMLSRPPTSKIISLGTLMHMDPFTHDAYREAYIEDEDFKEVFQ
jgi:hypothetical protein